MDLIVYRDGKRVGILSSTSDRGVVFSYEKGASPISLSMPDTDRIYREKECLPFFDGLLPEGNVRTQIASARHIPSNSVIHMLTEFGADVAGALTILPADEPFARDDGSGYTPITLDEIRKRTRRKNSIPLILCSRGVKLSLAGAENKVPVYYDGKGFFLPVSSSPTTHIIKACDEISVSEYVTTALATECGLDTVSMELLDFEEEKALLITRYDRVTDSDGRLKRVHQEDFCQALGIESGKKYEENGGPGIRDMLSVLGKYGSRPLEDGRKILDATVFNVLVGNCDAHGKNFSIIHSEKECVLSPLYDLVSSTIHPGFDRTLAMRIGKERRIDRITRDDFRKTFPPNIVDSAVGGMCTKYLNAISALEEKYRNDGVLLSVLERIREDSYPRVKNLQ